jgi:branched-chain amino acid transport system substrate-binding protein
MRKYLKLSLFVLMAVALVSTFAIGCGGGTSNPTATPSATTDANKSVYKIGAVLSLTGVYQNLGIPEKNTLDMLKDQINNAGGINGHAIDFIIVDDKSDATQTYTLAKQIVDENNPLAIVGPTTTGASLALINMSKDSGIPIISLAGGSKIVVPVTSWVFKMPPSEYQVSDMLLPYIATQNITKIAVIVSSSGWGSSGKAAIPVEAPKYNLSVVPNGSVEVYQYDATSTIPQLQVIKDSGAQAVVCWDTDQGSAMVARDMQTLNMTIPLFVSHGAANKGFITSSEDGANGAVLAVGKVLIADQLPTTDQQRPVLVKYKNDYEALYGAGTVNPFGGHAYDAVNILVPILTSMNESLNLADARSYIRDGIENTSNYIGIGGVYTMSTTDHLGLSQQLSNFLVLIKVVDGQWTWINQ